MLFLKHGSLATVTLYICVKNCQGQTAPLVRRVLQEVPPQWEVEDGDEEWPSSSGGSVGPLDDPYKVADVVPSGETEIVEIDEAGNEAVEVGDVAGKAGEPVSDVDVEEVGDTDAPKAEEIAAQVAEESKSEVSSDSEQTESEPNGEKETDAAVVDEEGGVEEAESEASEEGEVEETEAVEHPIDETEEATEEEAFQEHIGAEEADTEGSKEERADESEEAEKTTDETNEASEEAVDDESSAQETETEATEEEQVEENEEVEEDRTGESDEPTKEAVEHGSDWEEGETVVSEEEQADESEKMEDSTDGNEEATEEVTDGEKTLKPFHRYSPDTIRRSPDAISRQMQIDYPFLPPETPWLIENYQKFRGTIYDFILGIVHHPEGPYAALTYSAEDADKLSKKVQDSLEELDEDIVKKIEGMFNKARAQMEEMKIEKIPSDDDAADDGSDGGESVVDSTVS
eukprot:GHVN01061486.1.p1 GENE.GHVN01061486.1~~GHVN01061486.1.p1  ORF type:complete len:459 (+),score=128.13 GHVN01061486.1:2090-3466(+)